MNAVLLSRDAFRAAVFKRDSGRCVICGKPGQDAHHIIERRLWPDGGYYLDNGATVCGEDHLGCERTTISVEKVREAAGITSILVPPHLYPDQHYDKWGNPVLENGQRMRGELFFDASVQKVLTEGGVLGEFTMLVKYPRTYHLPWSLNVTKDDRVMQDLSGFVGQRVIVTEKMDGENYSLYREANHARSMDSRDHESQHWVKGMWGRIAHDIPDGWRVCGENLFAKHSIHYQDLPSYFIAYSVWTDKNVCLPWDETVTWAKLLGLETVPVLYDGLFDERQLKQLAKTLEWEAHEGYVVRTAGEIHYGDFRHQVAKFVRKGHVTTVEHGWRQQRVIPNGLRRQV